jgi:hypothetical protein
MSTLTSSKSGGKPPADIQSQKRPWPVTLLGFLLLLQCAGLFSIGGLNLSQVNWVKGFTHQNISLLFTYGLRGAAYVGLGI